jgi:hypothetical protein
MSTDLYLLIGRSVGLEVRKILVKFTITILGQSSRNGIDLENLCRRAATTATTETNEARSLEVVLLILVQANTRILVIPDVITHATGLGQLHAQIA